MKLTIISGLSGSGKTIALQTLEDKGLFCVDNLPVGMLADYAHRMRGRRDLFYEHFIVAIDARSGAEELKSFPAQVELLRQQDIQVEILFLTTDEQILLARYSETRRLHPLSREGLPLKEAIQRERKLLAPMFEMADLVMDSSDFNVHTLRAEVARRLAPDQAAGLNLLFQSFGYKYGLPVDTDFVFDVRCLPNPYWEPELRQQTGKERGVQNYLQDKEEVIQMLDFLKQFLSTWIPRFEAQNRSYMTVSVGCTGGQHRSVYLCEQLALEFSQHRSKVSLRHRELE